MTTDTLRVPPVAGLASRAPAWLTAIASGLLACGLAWLILNRPTLAILAALPFAALPLVLSGQARTLVFVLGSLAVFQSSDELTPQKILFFGAVMVSFGVVLTRLPRLVQTHAYHDLLPLLRASVVLFGVVLVSFVVSYANDVPQKPWLRDVGPYILVACAPFFALDAQASFSRPGLRRLVVVAGTLGAFAFTVVWLTNRMIADLSFIPIGLGTMLLPAAGFAYAMSEFLDGGRARLGWLALASAIPAMMLTTGTRTTLLLAVVPVAIVFGGRRRLTGRSLRLLVAVPLVVLFGLATIQGVVEVTGGDRAVLAKRFSLFSEIGTGNDQSYRDRVAQTNAAWALFRSSPLTGVGPGVDIAWNDSFGRPHLSPNVDSPVSFLTKYGVLGIVALGFLVGGYIGVLRRLRARTGRRTVAQYALIGYGATIVAWSVLVNSLEDKGLSIGLVVLLALAAREAAEFHRPDS
jgi:O-antigen ligase